MHMVIAEGAPALTIREARKAFGMPAVVGLNLTVKAGEFYALLGPNGAGKTTTLRLVAGLLIPDSGTIEVFGIDVRRHPIEAKRIIAWLPDEPMLYDRLDPLEFEDVRPLSDSDNPSQEILSIAAELEESGNPKHVRYATFHVFPRVM